MTTKFLFQTHCAWQMSVLKKIAIDVHIPSTSNASTSTAVDVDSDGEEMVFVKDLSRSAEDTTPKKPRTLIMIGNIGISGFIKGYVKGPLQRIARRLEDRALRKEKDLVLIYVNEYCTTKLCSFCNEECCYTSTRGHRYQYCKICRISPGTGT